MKREAIRRALPFFVFASGSCALIYESLWMRSFGLIFGNTTHAVAAILAVFMAGLALGSFLTGRIHFRRTIRTYALVELGVGIFSLLTIPLLYFLPSWYGSFARTHGLSAATELVCRLIAAALALLPPTTLLGMTFPLLIEFLTGSGRNFYVNMGFLYRTNTLGGAFGVFLVTFILMPLTGKFAVFILAVAANLTIGFLAWHWGKDLPEESRRHPRSKAVQTESTGHVAGIDSGSPDTLPPIFLLTAFTTGLFSFGLEILWTRSLALVIGSSIYAFNIMLIALLIGIVLGTIFYEVYWTRIKSPVYWLSVLLLAVGALCLIDLMLIGYLPILSFAIIKSLTDSFLISQGTNFVLCFLTMVLVTMPLGFIFPLLTHLVKLNLHSPQKITSRLYFWNTLGTVMGSFGTAFLLIPVFGLQSSFVILAALPFIVGWWFLGDSLRWTITARTGALIVCAALYLIPLQRYRPWNLYTMTGGIYRYGFDWRESVETAWKLPEFLQKGRQIIFYREGDEGVVCINEHEAERTISVNGKSDGGNGQDVITQRLIAHVPLMLHPNPQNALVIGWGTGSTAGSAGLYPTLKQIDCVEIEAQTFAGRSFFTDINFNIAADPRFKNYIKDGRNYLLTAPTRYDVILSEPSNPWITGVSNLFTKDFYSIAKSRLSGEGIFCQWFHYYNMSLQDIRVQTRTFADSFPHASMWLVPPRPVALGNPIVYGDILFIGSTQPHRLDYDRVRHWYANAAIRADLVPLGGVEDELAFLTNYFMNRDDMLRFSDGAQENTDDFPYLEYAAPKRLYLGPAEAQRTMVEIYRHFDAGGSEQFPPIVDFPPLAQGQLSKSRHADLCVTIGTCYLRKAFLTRARRLAETAVQEDDQNAAACALLGEALYDQGLNVEAENHLSRALDLNPKMPRPYHILGAIYLDRRELAKSEQVYQHLALQFPEDPVGWYGQALIMGERQNWSKAREFVDRALLFAPGMEDAQRLRDYLRQMK